MICKNKKRLLICFFLVASIFLCALAIFIPVFLCSHYKKMHLDIPITDITRDEIYAPVNVIGSDIEQYAKEKTSNNDLKLENIVYYFNDGNEKAEFLFFTNYDDDEGYIINEECTIYVDLTNMVIDKTRYKKYKGPDPLYNLYGDNIYRSSKKLYDDYSKTYGYNCEIEYDCNDVSLIFKDDKGKYVAWLVIDEDGTVRRIE